MINIYVKLEDYINFQKKFNTYYIDKKNKYVLNNNSKNIILNNFKLNEEIFNGIETKYNISNDNENYLITFKTNLNNEYRFDILKEPNTSIYHLAFSDINSNSYNYNDLTNRNESIEIFSRLSWILKDICRYINIDEFCIGATGNVKKDKIYEYMMSFVKSWYRKETNQYKLGWALYFKI